MVVSYMSFTPATRPSLWKYPTLGSEKLIILLWCFSYNCHPVLKKKSKLELKLELKLAKTPTNITKISKVIWYSFKLSFWILRWKTAGKIKATQEPLKLSMNDIKSAKCGIEIAGRSVRKFVNTRMPMNQTISGHLNGSESTEKISSIMWIMVMTLKVSRDWLARHRYSRLI